MKNNRRNSTPRRPRNFMELETNVSHIYDPSAKGTVVGHDTNEKGKFPSSLVVVQWQGDEKSHFCVTDELVDLTPRPPRRERRDR